jgi:hypothetical protein
MPDSLLERKDRFVCVTRAIGSIDPRLSSSEHGTIIEDIKLINERDNPPMNYSPIYHTIDTREKATTKKLICVKIVDRQPGMKCICDIVFLYRSKRPPQSYTIIGDINGLQMCLKEGTVPALRAPSNLPSMPSNIYANVNSNPVYTSMPYQKHANVTSDYGAMNTLTKKSDEKEILDGIPFEINPKYLSSMKQGQVNNPQGFDTMHILTPFEIEQRFNYDFYTERALL